MRKKLLFLSIIIFILYVSLWATCAYFFKQSVIAELNKHEIKYESVSIVGFPSFVGVKVHNLQAEIGTNYVIKCKAPLLFRADLPGRKYSITLPKTLTFHAGDQEPKILYTLNTRNAKLQFHFSDLPLERFKIQYFEQFHLPSQDAFKLLKKIALRVDELEVRDANNHIIAKNFGTIIETAFIKNGLPEFEADTAVSYNGTEYSEEYVKSIDLGDTNLNKIIYSFLIDEMYKEVQYNLNLKIKADYNSENDFKVALNINQSQNQKNISTHHLAGSAEFGFNKNKTENTSIFTSRYALSEHNTFTSKWYELAGKALLNGTREQNFIKNTPENINLILPKLHEFKYFNTILNFNLDLAWDKQLKFLKFDSEKVGFETDQYSLIAKGSVDIPENGAGNINLAINIGTYPAFINDAVLYGHRFIQASSDNPTAIEIDQNTVDRHKSKLTLLLTELSTQKGDTHLSIPISYNAKENKLLIGNKSLDYIISHYQINN